MSCCFVFTLVEQMAAQLLEVDEGTLQVGQAGQRGELVGCPLDLVVAVVAELRVEVNDLLPVAKGEHIDTIFD